MVVGSPQKSCGTQLLETSLLTEQDTPYAIIKTALIRSRLSSARLREEVNSRLASDRHRSAATVSAYVHGRQTPGMDWVRAAEDALGLERGILVDAFAARYRAYQAEPAVVVTHTAGAR
jgi:hypothetical protein